MINFLYNSLTTFAEGICKCVETSFFGKVCSTGEGTEVYAILSIVIQVLTAGIGILATIGIVYFGVQYLTSGDDPSKVKKAKSRLIAIVIGLATYAVIYSALIFLLPNFNPEKLNASFETCTETKPGGDQGGGGQGGGGQGGGDQGGGGQGGGESTGKRSPYCGPEAPGPYGELSSVQNKLVEYGSLVDKSSSCYRNNKGKYDNRVTKKYTTTSGRVYYVFKQCNYSWGCAPAGKSSSGAQGTMCSRGCQRTAEATIANSFGAKITPLYFSSSGGFNYTKLDKALNGLPVRRYDIKKNYADEIWKALQQGGAVVIHTKKPSVFTNDAHKLPIVDYKMQNGNRMVYIADTTMKGDNNGWKDLDSYVVKKGNIQKADAFVPTKELNCSTK